MNTTDIVIADVLIADIKARYDLGLSRYSRPLTPYNGRDQLRDAVEEGLDLVMYMKAAEIERADLIAAVQGFAQIAWEWPLLAEKYPGQVDAAKTLLARLGAGEGD
jgi:hypothetical protein